MGMADGFGLGPTIGFPTGLEALWWITPRIGLEAGAGVSLDWVQVYHADLMITVLRVTDKDTGVGKIVPRLVDAGPFFVSFGLGPRAVVTYKETE
jgi:hypothetical protein